MDIACPQCSMKYALDPRLLPPGGVPVQCTRCSHIFIAAPPTPAQGTGGTPSAPNLGSTVLYGSQAKPATSPSSMGTQVFGAVPQVPAIAPLAPVAAKPAPAAAPPSIQRTQVFGAVAPLAPAPVAAKPAPTAAPVPVAAKPAPTTAPVPAPKAPTGASPAIQRTQVFGAVAPPATTPGVAPTPWATPPPAATPPPTVTRPTVTAPAPAATRPPAPAAPANTPLAPPVPDLPGSNPGVARTFVPKPAGANTSRRPSVTSAPAVAGTPPVSAPAAPRPSGMGTPAVTSAPPPPPAAKPASPPPPAVPPGLIPAAPLWSPPSTPEAAAPESRPGASAGTPRPPGPARPSESFTAVAATTPIELPDEILVQLNRPISELMPEEPLDEPSAELPGNTPGFTPPPSMGVTTAAVNKPLELPPELLDTAQNVELAKAGEGRGSHRSRWVILSVSTVVIALGAALAVAFWPKSTALPHEVQAAKEEAVALLRRDDTTSKEEALGRLRTLSAARPQSVELLAELGIALAVHLDDTQVRAATLDAKVKQLQAQISRLTVSQTPADWQSRANALEEERAATQKELTPRQDLAHTLSLEALQVLRRLEATPEKESRDESMSRLRARTMLNAALGGNDTPDLARKLAQSGQSDWSSLAMAEYVLNQENPSPTQIKESALALEHLRETNKTYLRVYVLGARIALLRKELVSAQSLLDTVITLNPRHELAQQLNAYAHALAAQEREPHPPPPAPSPAPAPTPAPTAPQQTAPSPAPGEAPTTPSQPAPSPAPGSAAAVGNAPSP